MAGAFSLQCQLIQSQLYVPTLFATHNEGHRGERLRLFNVKCNLGRAPVDATWKLDIRCFFSNFGFNEARGATVRLYRAWCSHIDAGNGWSRRRVRRRILYGLARVFDPTLPKQFSPISVLGKDRVRLIECLPAGCSLPIWQMQYGCPSRARSVSTLLSCKGTIQRFS